jgi:hypothetical protein
MILARRVFRTTNRDALLSLLDLLCVLLTHKALDLSVVNRSQETFAYILCVPSSNEEFHVECHLKYHLKSLIAGGSIPPRLHCVPS